MLNRYPNLTYVVVVVLVDADEMVTYGDSDGPNRYYILFPSPLAFLYRICFNQEPYQFLLFSVFFFCVRRIH